MSSLKRGASASRLLAAALRYAGRGVRSSRDVREYLSRLGAAPAAGRAAEAACRDRGLIDDAAAAVLWAGQWARQGYARAAVRERLAVKGFDAGVIDRALGRPDPGAEVRRAAALIERRRRRGRPGRAALARVLAAKGYDHDVIEQAVNRSSTNDPPNDEP